MRYLSIQEILSEQIDFRNICVFPVREALGRENIKKEASKAASFLFVFILRPE